MIDFISDIHILNREDPAYSQFLKWLRMPREKGSRVVLIGDVFEFFLGTKKGFYKQYHEVWQEIQRLAESGLSVDYVEGNHDFLLNPKIDAPFFKVHKESVALEAGGYKIWVEHGDLANTEDEAYLRWRKFIRSPSARVLQWLFPKFLLDRIAERLSRWSKDQRPTPLTPEQRSIYVEHARKKSHEGFDAVVMGHCHDLHDAEFVSEGRKSRYFNLGYPKSDGSFLRFDPAVKQWTRISWKNFEPIVASL